MKRSRKHTARRFIFRLLEGDRQLELSVPFFSSLRSHGVDMEIVPIESFAVAVDVPFLSPLGFQQARLEEFAARICDREKGLSLRPDQIRLRRTDELYNYELSAQFFGENGSLTRTPLGVHLAIRNGRTDRKSVV